MRYFIKFNAHFASEFANALFRTTFSSVLHVLTNYGNSKYENNVHLMFLLDGAVLDLLLGCT